MQYASCIVVDRDGPLLAILPVDADLLPLSDTTRPTIAVVIFGLVVPL
jgi:hypothetical protein